MSFFTFPVPPPNDVSGEPFPRFSRAIRDSRQ